MAVIQPLSVSHAQGEQRSRRKDKGKERARDTTQVDDLHMSSSVAGPSKPSRRANAASGPSWDCIPIARSEVTSIPPVWSKDGRFYFTAANTSVFVHSSTGPNFERLSTLSSTDRDGHRKPINALVLHPTNPLQLITASDDGTIKLWDWVEGRHVRTITVADDGAVKNICVGQVADKWWIFLTVTNPKPGKKVRDDGSHLQHRVMRAPLVAPTPSADDKPVPVVFGIGKLRSAPAAIMISPRTSYVVALAGAKAYVYRLPTDIAEDKWKPNCVKFVSDVPFTCGAFAPDRRTSKSEQEEWFATGDEKGVIRLWHGLGAAFRQLDAAAVSAQQAEAADKPLYPDTEKRLPTTSLHWHAHAVAALAFTSAGAQIISVGEESVLVQWHLASGKREYIPRLGGRPILSVAVRPGARGSEEEFWMGFADGALMRVGAATGHVSPVGQGVRLDPLRPTSKRPYPISVHPASKALVVPSSHPSTLQFIDPIGSSVMFDLEVAPSNRVSKRDDKELEPVAVELVTFSAPRDGRSEWMATVEGRPLDEEEGGGLVKTLKFWQWNGDRYIVNTQYPRPHGTDDITALSFGLRDDQPYALTAGAHGSVKVWQVRQARKSEQGKASKKKPVAAAYYWTTRSTFTYRNLGVNAAAFSPDATLIALAHGTVVTLWDTANNVLLRALDCAIDARKLAFAGSDGRYVVVGGAARGVVVWDLLSCNIVTTMPSHPVDVLLPMESGFSTSTSTPTATTLHFYQPNGTLIRTSTVKTPFTVLAALPSPSIHLVGIAPSGEIFRFGELQAATAPAARAVSSATQPARQATSIWQEMFGKDAFLDELTPEVEGEEAVTAVSALQRRAAGHPEQVFDGPSHTLPPVSMLFEAFMDELLVSRSGEVEEPEDVIMVDAEPEVAEAPYMSADAVRAVNEREMAELEGYFKELRASAPPRAAAVPKAKGRPNGIPNGHGRAVSTPTKASKAKVASPAVSTPGDEADVVDGKRKSKKRKAPRHSET